MLSTSLSETGASPSTTPILRTCEALGEAMLCSPADFLTNCPALVQGPRDINTRHYQMGVERPHISYRFFPLIIA